MAGILIGNAAARSKTTRQFSQTKSREKHADIHDPFSKSLRAGLIPGSAQHKMIFMHGRAAAGGVGQDGINVSRKCIQIPPGKSLRSAKIARMPGQSAATPLRVGQFRRAPRSGGRYLR